MQKKIFCLAFVLFLCIKAVSQPLRVHVNKDYDGLPFFEFVIQLESTSDLQFFYNAEWVQNTTIKQKSIPQDLHSILQETLSYLKLSYVLLHNKYVVLVNSIDDAGGEGGPDETYELRGVVKNSANGEGIVGAHVAVPAANTHAITQADGSFSLTLTAGTYELVANALGMAPAIKSIRLFDHTFAEIEMFDSVIELDEVFISGSPAQEVHSVGIGVKRMSIENIRSVPPLLGEVDIVRSVLSLPGVTTVGEGAAGFNVRGGNVDQNLIIVDNAPIFNASHLFGIFSAVNSDMVSSLSLHKGTMPARYGGRLSSVLDINFKEAGETKFTMDGSAGAISSKLRIAVPIIKEKTSMVASVRMAYPDWTLRLIPDPKVRSSRAGFYDVSGKIFHKVNQRNTLSLTTHLSNDYFRLGADTTYRWSGQMVSAKWNHTFSDFLSSRMSAFHSQSSNGADGESFANGFKLTSDISNTGFNYHLDWDQIPEHQVELGLQTSFYRINRGHLQPLQDSVLTSLKIPIEQGLEYGIYLSDAIDAGPLTSVSVGLRASGFAFLGPVTKTLYLPGAPMNEGSATGEIMYKKNEVAHASFKLEPRIAIKRSLSPSSSLKAGYSRNFQYLSLLSNSSAVSPIDTWKLSDYYLQPQMSNQLTAVFFKTFADGAYEISLEAYYKKLKDITQYKEGARLLLNQNIETELLRGTGKSYGVEIYMKKNAGRATGWLSYTYSRSFIRVAGEHDEEVLNSGRFFPGNFDKPHDLSLVSSYAISDRFSFSGSFVYNTGRPITYPNSFYVLDGYVIADFSEINQSRIPDYHRLDLSLSFTQLPHKSRKFETGWSVGVYNVYARKNPYSVFFKEHSFTGYPQPYQLSVLGTAIPYFALNFKVK